MGFWEDNSVNNNWSIEGEKRKEMLRSLIDSEKKFIQKFTKEIEVLKETIERGRTRLEKYEKELRELTK